MHDAAQVFDRARVIGAAKNISLKKSDSVRFKIIFKKELKLKKNSVRPARETAARRGMGAWPATAD